MAKDTLKSIGIIGLSLATLICTGSTLYNTIKWSGYKTDRLLEEGKETHKIEEIATSDNIQDRISDQFEVYQQNFQNEKISLSSFRSKTEKLLSDKNIRKYIDKYGTDEQKESLEVIKKNIEEDKANEDNAFSNAFASAVSLGLCIYGIHKANKDKDNDKLKDAESEDNSKDNNEDDKEM